MTKHFKRDLEMRRLAKQVNNHKRKVMMKNSRLANSKRMEHYRAHMLKRKLLEEGMDALHPSQMNWVSKFLPMRLLRKLFMRKQKEGKDNEAPVTEVEKAPAPDTNSPRDTPNDKTP